MRTSISRAVLERAGAPRVEGFLTALLAAAAIACAPAALAQAGGKPETSELQVGIVPIAAHSAVFAAQEFGYLEQEGLKVTLQFGAGGAALLPLLVQGQLQIGHVPVSTALQARARNIDVVMIGPGLYMAKDRPPEQTATMVKADSPIRTVADLSGKRIAVNVINSANWLYNRAMLEKHGVNPKAVTYVELPFPNMIDAIANSQVDAAAVVQPFVFFGLSGKKTRILAHDFLEVQPGVQVAAFAVARKWAQANPRTVAGFSRAVARAVDDMNANPEKAKALIAKFTKSKPEVIEGTGLPSLGNVLDPADIEKQMDLMVRHGMLTKRLSVSEAIWQPSRQR